MNVIGYTEGGMIRVIFVGDEGESFVPDDMANRHRQIIAEWEAAGNTIPPYVAPVLPPQPLPRLTFWLAAAEIGVTRAGIKARIEAMTDAVEREKALVYFEEAQVYRRDDPLLNAMAEAEGITQIQLDSLWAWAPTAS